MSWIKRNIKLLKLPQQPSKRVMLRERGVKKWAVRGKTEEESSGSKGRNDIEIMSFLGSISLVYVIISTVNVIVSDR